MLLGGILIWLSREFVIFLYKKSSKDLWDTEQDNEQDFEHYIIPIDWKYNLFISILPPSKRHHCTLPREYTAQITLQDTEQDAEQDTEQDNVVMFKWVVKLEISYFSPHFNKQTSLGGEGRFCRRLAEGVLL